MSGKKISIFLLLFGFVLGLMAFQSSTDNLSRLFTDSIQFVIPTNFPKPVYAPKDNQLSSDGFLLGKALFMMRFYLPTKRCPVAIAIRPLLRLPM